MHVAAPAIPDSVGCLVHHAYLGGIAFGLLFLATEEHGNACKE